METNYSNGMGVNSGSINGENSLGSLVTPKDIASLLKVSAKTVYYWVRRNQIPFVRVGRHIRFSSEEVLGYFYQRTEELKPSCVRAQLLVNKGDSRSLKIRTARHGNFTSLHRE